MSIKTFFLKTASKVKLSAKTNYPKWMVIGGTGIMIGAGVYACVQTAKHMNEILDKHNERMNALRDIKEQLENGETVEKEDGTEWTIEDVKKGKTAVMMGTIGAGVKTYGPPVALALIGAFFIAFGFKKVEGRWVATAAELYAANEAFKAYRGRVTDRFGKDVEEEIFVNGVRHLVKEKEIDPETGEEREVTKEVLYSGDPNTTRNLYQYIFDECNCPHAWSKHPGYNYTYLVNLEKYANEYLHSHGSITLYEVLKQIGFDPEPETMNIGWMVDNPTGYGDNYISFGICNASGNYEDVGYFSGGQPDYMLNFNCDGDIQAALILARENKKKLNAELKAKRKAEKKKPIAKAVIKGV